MTDPLARAARCRVTFFLYFNPAQELRDLLRQQGRELDDGPQWVPVTIQLELKPADMTSGRTVSGTATDPRGWELKYTFCAKDGRVEGTYEQPNDRGTFLLQETT